MTQVPSATQARCGNRACGKPLEHRPTGRPARYCGAACRQAVHRARARHSGADSQLTGTASSRGPGQDDPQPGARDAGDAGRAAPDPQSQAPRAWPSWSWSIA